MDIDELATTTQAFMNSGKVMKVKISINKPDSACQFVKCWSRDCIDLKRLAERRLFHIAELPSSIVQDYLGTVLEVSVM